MRANSGIQNKQHDRNPYQYAVDALATVQDEHKRNRRAKITTVMWANRALHKPSIDFLNTFTLPDEDFTFFNEFILDYARFLADERDELYRVITGERWSEYKTRLDKLASTRIQFVFHQTSI